MYGRIALIGEILCIGTIRSGFAYIGLRKKYELHRALINVHLDVEPTHSARMTGFPDRIVNSMLFCEKDSSKTKICSPVELSTPEEIRDLGPLLLIHLDVDLSRLELFGWQ
jgi:hypothetical protein